MPRKKTRKIVTPRKEEVTTAEEGIETFAETIKNAIPVAIPVTISTGFNIIENLTVDEGLFLIQESHPELVLKIKLAIHQSKEEQEKLQQHIQDILEKTLEIQSRDQQIINANKLLHAKIQEVENIAKKLILKEREYESIKTDAEKYFSDAKDARSKLKTLEIELKQKQKSINELLLKLEEYQQLVRKYKSKCTLL